MPKHQSIAALVFTLTLPPPQSLFQQTLCANMVVGHSINVFSRFLPTLYIQSPPFPFPFPLSPSSPPFAPSTSQSTPFVINLKKGEKRTPKPQKVRNKKEIPFYSSILCHPFEERRGKWKRLGNAEEEQKMKNRTPT